MENRLLQYFSKFTTLTAAEEEALIASMVTKHFRKGDFVVKEGQHNENTFFVLEGLVRQFKVVDETDITTNFYSEGQWIMSLAGFSEDSYSKDNLVCVEDTELVVGNEEKAVELFQQFPQFETLSRQVMEAAFAEQQNLMSHYITDKPEQRYLKLLETRPDILQRVPQYDIASYIGVKPESLSRIRKKLQAKS